MLIIIQIKKEQKKLLMNLLKIKILMNILKH